MGETLQDMMAPLLYNETIHSTPKLSSLIGKFCKQQRVC